MAIQELQAGRELYRSFKIDSNTEIKGFRGQPVNRITYSDVPSSYYPITVEAVEKIEENEKLIGETDALLDPYEAFDEKLEDFILELGIALLLNAGRNPEI